MQLMVADVIDGESFRVNPDWNVQGERRDIVLLRDHTAPQLGTKAGEAFKQRLEELVLNRSVEILQAVRVGSGIVEADVFISGQNIAEQMLTGA